MLPFAGNHYRVLVVEDDAQVRDLLTYNLHQEGIEAESSEDGRSALEKLRRNSPDLIILDAVLPDVSGLEVCRKIRSCDRTAMLPIMMVSANPTEADKVLGLNMGADDYVTKPFGALEMTARIKALLRRTAAAHQLEPSGQLRGTVRHGRLSVDFDSYQAFIDGERCELRPREFHLLAFFVRHPMRVFNREELLRLVWGPEVDIEARTVDVHVRRLRTLLETDDSKPRIIVTVRRGGYRFEPDALEAPGFPLNRKAARVSL
jgi:DNA-binding response OmpR family regulator